MPPTRVHLGICANVHNTSKLGWIKALIPAKDEANADASASEDDDTEPDMMVEARGTPGTKTSQARTAPAHYSSGKPECLGLAQRKYGPSPGGLSREAQK